MKKMIIFVLLVLSIDLIGQSDSLIFFGKVFDSNSLEILPFANLQITNSSRGTTTNEDGEFSIAVISTDDEIMVSYVGYKSGKVDSKSLNPEESNFIYLDPININLQEVTIYSNSALKSEDSQSSTLTLQSERIKEIAVGMPDILRSMQSMPGITTNNEFKANYNVRGGNQDENLVLVNGIRTYEPFHIKEAANASVGIFNVDLIKKADIITGGFSAKYGDKMSSVLKIDYREGDKDKYSGAASLSLAYLDGFIEGPIGNNGSFIFGARKSYMEYVLSMIDYEDISSAEPSFYDLQGVLSFNLSSRSKILLQMIHAGDDFTYKPNNSFSNRTETENNIGNYTSTMIGVRSQNIISSEAILTAEVNYYDQGDNEYRLFLRDYSSLDRTVERLTYDTLKIKTIEFKTDLQYQVSNNYQLDLGISYQNINYERNSDDIWKIDNSTTYPGDYGNDAINSKSFKNAAYFENIIAVDEFTFNIGGRLDYFDLNKDLTLSPRLSAAYKFNESTKIRAAWGYFYQSPIYDQILYSESSDTNTQSQLRNTQYNRIGTHY